MDNKFVVKFTEIKEIDFELDFQKIYDFVKNAIIESDIDWKPTKWDIHNEFGDNMDYYIEKIYGYNVEDNDSNGYAIDYIFQEWGKWIDNYKFDTDEENS